MIVNLSGFRSASLFPSPVSSVVSKDLALWAGEAIVAGHDASHSMLLCAVRYSSGHALPVIAQWDVRLRKTSNSCIC